MCGRDGRAGEVARVAGGTAQRAGGEVGSQRRGERRDAEGRGAGAVDGAPDRRAGRAGAGGGGAGGEGGGQGAVDGAVDGGTEAAGLRGARLPEEGERMEGLSGRANGNGLQSKNGVRGRRILEKLRADQ